MVKGITFYHMTAFTNQVHLLDHAISKEQHISIDMRSETGWTPAHHASVMGHMDALSLLLEHGADLSLQNEEGVTAYG